MKLQPCSGLVDGALRAPCQTTARQRLTERVVCGIGGARHPPRLCLTATDRVSPSSLIRHTINEGPAQNSGVVRAAYSFPPGTHSLRFAFRFTTPGEGDFLSVSFGDFSPIFTGKDMPLTRDGELTVDVPVEPLAGEEGELAFRLVSRGQQNAVVTIHDLVALTVEDADHDGLSNAAEAALGTSAMRADADGDGVSDARR